jgi:hypothetical protein
VVAGVNDIANKTPLAVVGGVIDTADHKTGYLIVE